MKHLPIGHWWQGGLILTLGLVGIVIGTFYTPISASLKCDRLSPSQINCELRRFYVLRGVEKLRIYDPQQANVITTAGSRRGRTYKIVIVNEIKEFEFLPSSSSYKNNQEVASQINNFIYSQQQSLFLSQHQWHDYSFFVVIIIFFLGFGIFLVTTPIVDCTFYKSLNKVIIERKGLRTRQLIEYPLINISRIDIQEKKVRYGKIYRPILVLISLEQIPIHEDYTNEKNTQNSINSICNFLAQG
ncbi:hypothetical protein QUB80_16575 [Chlorogloeopsis sp. ULAP01]|uniref:hypothetical protein n=1 Tax=Chlorogloeopsis sp. ULAP01 TaxID=3056483 RepID=UPI0025AA5BB4|nr:hypothetical protein [Chlorogloeopsis sp. ULAP01]MDM9382321.1 hypothetical protein [Chlorogloeopsis sp. ULAP01]